MNLMKLSLSGDTFSAFKTDFDNVLQVTLNKMLENNESEGVLTAKVTVHLSDEVTDDGLEIRRPLIAHDIKSVVQAKSAVSGLLTGELCPEMGQGYTGLCAGGCRPGTDQPLRRIITGDANHGAALGVPPEDLLQQGGPRRVPKFRVLSGPHGGGRFQEYPGGTHE